MTNRAAWAARRGALAGILLPGAIALAIIARTLLFYAGHDSTASLLVAAMGVCLALGLAELWLRSTRTLALADELASLPPALDERELEQLSPTLRQLLRARLEHAPGALRGESITPYLVGLLVMLGLLGTLLGLFETLSGAGQALTASASVDALRSGLSGPMRGLTRSFGCSAAGVGASAMLGLAAALVRRREARVLGAIQACAQGPLRELSPLRRQTSALQQLANQGDALPKAASALELAAERLGGLAERWETAHRAATAAQHKALEQALQGLRGELGRAAQDAGRALQTSLSGELQKLLASSGAALSEHVAKTARAAEQDALARRAGDAALREKLQQELGALRAALEHSLSRQDELVAAQTSALAGASQRLGQLAEAAGQQLERLGDGVGPQLRELAEGVGQQLSNVTGSVGEQLGRLSSSVDQQLSSVTGSVGEQLSHVTGSVGEQLGRLSGSLDQQLNQVAGSVSQRLDQLSGSLGQQLGLLADGLGQQLETRLALAAELSERARAAQALLERSAAAFEQTLARQAQTVDALVGQGREQLAELQESAAQGTLVAVERVVQLAQSQAERLAQFESELQRAQQGHAQGLSEQLTSHAAQLGAGLEGTGTLVREAADLLKASSVELSAVAESFASSVERQRESAASWLETLGELEGAVERAGRGAAADALGDQLASTQEVFARQLQFQRELFEQLRSLRSPAPAGVHGEHDVSA